MLLQLTEIFINVITPVFLLVVVGYLLGPRLDLQARTLTKYSYYLLAPAFIVNVLKSTQIQAAIAIQMIVFILLVHLGCAALAFGVGWLFRRPANMIAAYILIAVFGNVGNFGLPIIQFRLGEAALAAASIYFLAIVTIAFIIGVLAASWHKGGGINATLSVLKTPAIVAIAPALLLNWTDTELPLFMSRSIGLLAGAMIPTMLVTLGIQLAGAGRPKINFDVITASSIRLIGGPVLALLIVIPFGLSGIERGAGIFQASMPAAILCSLIAIEHNLLPDFVTTTVLFSTLASVVTLTVVLAVI
jgi:predicted permease